MCMVKGFILRAYLENESLKISRLTCNRTIKFNFLVFVYFKINPLPKGNTLVDKIIILTAFNYG